MSRHRRSRQRAELARPLLQLLVEQLEARALLSIASEAGLMTPAVADVLVEWGEAASSGDASTSISPAAFNPNPVSGALSPSQISRAYSIPSTSTAGAGITIAIVNAYHNPNIQSDLAAFSARYGLPTASLTVVNQYGQTSNYPAVDSGWALETAMDVEWAHAIAPGAKLVLVEAKSASVSDLMTAVQTAARMANVVSMSWGGSEFSGQKAYDSATYFASANVTYVAASGDDGGISGVSWPSSSPYVVSVGGTTLSVSSTGSYLSETSWSGTNSRWTGASGSTGGVSTVESLPTYQSTALGTRYATGRVTPDVAMDGNPTTGVSVYSTTPVSGQSGWFKVGGTSAGSPIWAGIIAVADQVRRSSGLATLSSSQTLSALYSLYGTSSARAASYATSFHDIISGSNFAGAAVAGYDKVTGLGSPIASSVISALGRAGSSVAIVQATTEVVTSGTTTATASATVAITATSTETVVVQADALVTLPFSSVTLVTPRALTQRSGAALAPALFNVARALPPQVSVGQTVDTSSHTNSDDLAFAPLPPAPSTPGSEAEPEVGDFGPLPDEPALDPIAARTWDAALDAVELQSLRSPSSNEAGFPEAGMQFNPFEVPPPSRTAAASVAAFIWGLWEYRSRSERAQRERRRPGLPVPSRN